MESISGVAKQALRKELAADNNVPAHCEDTHKRQAAGNGVQPLAQIRQQRQNLRGAQYPGIFSVPGQRIVTGLAVHARVLASLFDAENIGVAGFASLIPGVHEKQSRDLRQRIRPVMTIFTEALRNKPCSEAEEDHHSNQEHPDNPQKML